MRRLLGRLRRLLAGNLRRQLILGVAGVHAVMMTIFVYDLVERQRDFLMQRQVDQVRVLAENLALAASGWVLSRDYAGMAELIAAQQRNPELVYAMLVNAEGVVLAHSEPGRVGLRLDDPASRAMLATDRFFWLAKTAELTDAAAPILANGRLIGWARTGLSQRQTLGNLDKAARDGLLYTLAAILVGSLLAWLMGHRLTAKLYAVRRASEAVRGGDSSARAPDLGGDEAGRLGRDFNAMLDALQQRGEELTLARNALARSEERFNLAMRGANDGLWDWDLVNDTVYFSPRWKEMIGYGEAEIGDSPDEWASRLHPDDLARATATVRAYLDGDLDKYEITFRFRHRDGHYLWILSRGLAIRDERGQAVRIVGTHVDISARVALEEALHEEKELAQVTLASIGDAVLATDAAGRLTFLNPVAERLTGWPLEEARGRGVGEVMRLVDEMTGEPAENPVERCRREGVVVGMANHTVLVARDGTRIAVEDSAAPIFDREGQLVGIVMVFHDVTAAREITQRMTWQVAHDSLTGLYNRREFEHRLAVAVENAHVSHAQHALLYLDLDQFKIVNDTCGHMAGDDLLRQLAFMMQEQMRKNDLLARLGGDEFGVLLENCPQDRALAIADKLRAVIREFRFAWQERVFEIGVSVGLVTIDRSTANPAEALSAADVACYAAKDQGRNRVHVYRPEDMDHAGRHGEMHMAANIRAAIQEDRLVLHAQEIRPLKAMHEDAHFEILVRLRDGGGSLLSPGSFIPAAERYGLMPDLDRWVIRNALGMAGRSAGGRRISLSINLSALSLLEEGMTAFIREQLKGSGVRPDRVCFEITETAAITHLGQGIQFMRELRAMGCRFALDDFGSGMSSFGYLKVLPVECIKIDGAFVRDIASDVIDRTFVETINRIGQVMGMRTVAEFVETEAILGALVEIGVDYVQGFGIARPVPFEQVLEGFALDIESVAGARPGAPG